ncbi:MAG: thiol reductant ABC exporter subunit CydD [Candidatus Dormibacteria bacterium]
MPAGTGIARRAAGSAIGPVERRLLREPAVRRAVAVSFAIGLVSAASVVVQAVALAGLLAGAMGSATESILPPILWLAGAISIRGLCALAGELVAGRGAEIAKAELRRKLLGAALRRASSGGADGGGAGGGDVATLAGRGIDALDAYIGRCLPDLVLAAAVPIALVAVIGALDWVSAIIVVAVLCLFPVFGVLVGQSSGRLAARRWDRVEAFGRQIADIFEGLPVLKAFGRSTRQRERIAEAAEGLRLASLSTLRVAFLSALVLDTLASVSVALVGVPLGLRLLSGSIHLAPALAVLIVAPEVFLPLRRASAEFHESTEGLAAARRAMDVIGDGDRGREEGKVARESGDDRRDGGEPTAGGPGPGDPARVPVALRRVRLELPGRAEAVLDDASLTILPGEKVVLVGLNGAGKSTTLSLLLGFMAPSSGAVTVGGMDLRGFDAQAWRRRLSYLSERPTLITGSLAENLRLADPAAGDARLREVLGQMGAGDLLASLPQGLDTQLGVGGRQVSTGERQRIALARAALRDASLLLLDEPTSHLDDATEATVVEALGRALSGRSALIVTHRPAVMRLADRVVTLQGGRFLAADGADLGGAAAAPLPGAHR